MNTDAAVTSNESYGSVAALCRDVGGTFLGASCITFRNTSDPEILEALELRETLACWRTIFMRKKIHVAGLQEYGVRNKARIRSGVWSYHS